MFRDWEIADFIFMGMMGFLLTTVLSIPIVLVTASAYEVAANKVIFEKNIKVADRQLEEFGVGKIVEIYDREMVVVENKQGELLKVWIGKSSIPLRGEWWSLRTSGWNTAASFYLSEKIGESSEQPVGDADVQRLNDLRQFILDTKGSDQ